MGHHCQRWPGLLCTHVGALLFKIEAAVRIRGKKTVTDVPAYWKIPAGINKVHGEVAHKIDFTSAKAQRIASHAWLTDTSQQTHAPSHIGRLFVTAPCSPYTQGSLYVDNGDLLSRLC